MKTIIYILFLAASLFTNAQKKEKDYNIFYRGGDPNLKPIKYVLFDSTISYSKKKIDNNQLNFHIDGESFIHKKNQTIDTCSIDFLQKVKLENPADLQKEEYNYFKKKKKEFENSGHIKIPNSLPISSTHLYFKVFILEKVKGNKVLKYEVDWIYSSF